MRTVVAVTRIDDRRMVRQKLCCLVAVGLLDRLDELVTVWIGNLRCGRNGKQRDAGGKSELQRLHGLKAP